MSQAMRYEYTTYWIYKRRPDWHDRVSDGWEADKAELVDVFNHPGDGVTIRGVYLTLPFREDADLMVWAHAEDETKLRDLAIRIDKTTIGRSLDRVKTLFGVGGMSQYDKAHGPSFMQPDKPGLRYMGVYPFIKHHEWYQLPYEERRDQMMQHGRMGHEFPNVLTNTTNSFGIQDQEFIVALEGHTPNEIVVMAQKLREATVRPYTKLDTPIWFGEMMLPEHVLDCIRG